MIFCRAANGNHPLDEFRVLGGDAEADAATHRVADEQRWTEIECPQEGGDVLNPVLVGEVDFGLLFGHAEADGIGCDQCELLGDFGFHRQRPVRPARQAGTVQQCHRVPDPAVR